MKTFSLLKLFLNSSKASILKSLAFLTTEEVLKLLLCIWKWASKQLFFFFFSLCYYNMKYKVISFCVFKETGKLSLTGTLLSPSPTSFENSEVSLIARTKEKSFALRSKLGHH